MTDRKTEGLVCCEEVCENLSAIHDGELLTLPHSRITEHLNECSLCRFYQISLPRLFNQMRDDSDIACDKERLWGLVLAKIEEDPIPLHTRCKQVKSTRSVWPVKRVKRWIASLSIAASVMFGVVSVGLLMSVPDELHSAVLVTEIVRDFKKFESQGRVFDFREDESGSSISWIAGKVDFNLPAVVKSPSGYQAAGVRLCSLLGKRIAFIQYSKDQRDLENQKDLFSVYVMKAEKIDLPEGGPRLTGRTPEGMTTVAWKEGDVGYVIISGLPVERINSLIHHSPTNTTTSL